MALEENGADGALEAAAHRLERARQALIAREVASGEEESKLSTLTYILPRILDAIRHLRKDPDDTQLRMGYVVGKNSLRNGYPHLVPELDEFEAAAEAFMQIKE